MPIPKAAANDVFGYYFHHAVFVRDDARCFAFLDHFAYKPVLDILYDEEGIWVGQTDAEHIFAPYLTIRASGDCAEACYDSPDMEEERYALRGDEYRVDSDGIRIKLFTVMSHFGKRGFQEATFAALEIDPAHPNIGSDNNGLSFSGEPAHPQVVFAGFRRRMPYINIVKGKDRGEMNYCMWYEPAKRLIPYRMYIPFSYEPGTPQKTIVCFHGGDANCDYMFYHTKGEIERWAEREGYILLAPTSYRKYTFFGASRFPTGAEPFDPEQENPLGLSEEEWETSLIAEHSVLVQIEDAAARYTLDFDHFFALGNSGGSLGIFRQIQAIGKPFFKAVCCSGGVPSPGCLDYECIKETKTQLLLLMSGEDEFDGQFTGRVAYPFFVEKGLEVTLKVVGGGHHLTGWTGALEEVFAFFGRYR